LLENGFLVLCGLLVRTGFLWLLKIFVFEGFMILYREGSCCVRVFAPCVFILISYVIGTKLLTSEILMHAGIPKADALQKKKKYTVSYVPHVRTSHHNSMLASISRHRPSLSGSSFLSSVNHPAIASFVVAESSAPSSMYRFEYSSKAW
jgi:hypothetical protein